jgi:glycosyltransferase involved in cell wall biosynthesis
VTPVLHVITRAERRGAEVGGCDLRYHLTGRGWPGDVVALAPAGDGAPLAVPTLGTAPRSVATTRELRRRARGARVVVAHGSATLPAAAVGLALGGPPFVYVSIGDPRYWATTPARRWRTRTALHHAAAVVALAPAARRTLIDFYGLDPTRVRVLPNFRSARRFVPPQPSDRADARRALGIPADADVALVLGALSDEKRPLAAIAAGLAVPGLHVLVVGGGPLLPQARDVASRNPGRVTVTGGLDDPLPALHAADVIAVASASEGLPGVLVEAGLCGIPAAATDVGWISDVVVDGRTGALCAAEGLAHDPAPLTAALERTLRHRVALGRAARAHCEQGFSDEAVLPGWVALLEHVAGSPPEASVPRPAPRVAS